MSPHELRPTSPPAIPTTVLDVRPAEANPHVLLTLFKWRRLILASGALLALAAAVGLLLRPSLQTAVAKVLIKTDRSPVAGLPAPTARGGYSFELLQTETEFIRSPLVLLPVARALRAQRGEGSHDGDLAADVAALRGSLAVTTVPNTTILQATNQADDGAEAERVLGLIIDHYVEQRAAAFSGSASFFAHFQRETATATARLKQAEDQLRTWQDANDVIALEAQITAQLSTVGELEGAVRRNEAEIEATRSHIATLTRDTRGLPAESITSRDQVPNPLIAQLKAELAAEEAGLRDPRRNPIAERLRVDVATAEVALREASMNPVVARLKAELVTAEIALLDLRQRYTDQDRRVQEKTEQIRRIQQEIGSAEAEALRAARDRIEGLKLELASAERAGEAAARMRMAGLTSQLEAAERQGGMVARETIAPHPLRESLGRELVAARARLTSVTAQHDALRQQLDAARGGVGRLREKRVHFDRLAREVELAKAVYMQNVKRLDDAQTTASLEKSGLASVVVIEPPRRAGGGTSRTRSAVVIAGAAVVGLALGGATAFGLEFFNAAFRTRDDVEHYLGVPVLAAIPAADGTAARSLGTGPRP